MTILPDTFCVFILSHGRPDNIVTYKTLKKCGYNGRLYFIVDNEDKTVDRYRDNFGPENIIVFDKKAEADLCDLGNNFNEHRVILMARNACFKIARQLGITHFLELDDDYTAFHFRFTNSHGFTPHIKDINKLFLTFLDFYDSTPILSIAFSQGGDHVGGFKVTKMKRKAMNSFFCSTKRPFRFVGGLNEDVNTYTTLGSRGKLFFTFMSVMLVQKQTQSQLGGMTESYQLLGTYCKSFTTVNMMPSSVCVAMMNSTVRRLHHLINWPTTVPCIIPQEFQKLYRPEIFSLNDITTEKEEVMAEEFYRWTKPPEPPPAPDDSGPDPFSTGIDEIKARSAKLTAAEIKIKAIVTELLPDDTPRIFPSHPPGKGISIVESASKTFCLACAPLIRQNRMEIYSKKNSIDILAAALKGDQKEIIGIPDFLIRPISEFCFTVTRLDFKLLPVEQGYFLDLINIALDGNIPYFVGWHKDVIDHTATQDMLKTLTVSVYSNE